MKTIKLPFPLRALRSLEFPHKLGIYDFVFKKVLGKHGVCWVNTAAGIPWKLNLSSPTHRWIVYGKYEGAPFLDWARKNLPLDGIVVDSGANIGQMLLYLAQWVPKGKVLAYEPGLLQTEWLKECLEVNPTLPVRTFLVGLGNVEHQAFVRVIGDDGRYSEISDTEGDPIRIVKLSDHLAQLSITRVDLWKLDVEGYEIYALQGAEDLLRNKNIGALYIEMFSERGREIAKYLSGLGYGCYKFERNGRLRSHFSGDFGVLANALFLPRN